MNQIAKILTRDQQVKNVKHTNLSYNVFCPSHIQELIRILQDHKIIFQKGIQNKEINQTMIQEQETQLKDFETTGAQNSVEICQNIVDIQTNSIMSSQEGHLLIEKMMQQLDVSQNLKPSQALLHHLLLNYDFFGEEILDETPQRCDACHNRILKSSFFLHHRFKPIKLKVGNCCLELMENFGAIKNPKKTVREYQKTYCIEMTQRLLQNLEGFQKQFVSTILKGYLKDKTTYPTSTQRNKLFRLFEKEKIQVNKYNFRVRVWKAQSFQKVKPKRIKNIRFKLDKKRSSQRKSNFNNDIK